MWGKHMIDAKTKAMGKKKSTMISGKLSIMKFEKGIRLKMRNQEPLYLDLMDANILALHIREYSHPTLFTSVQVEEIKKEERDAALKEAANQIKKKEFCTCDSCKCIDGTSEALLIIHGLRGKE